MIYKGGAIMKYRVVWSISLEAEVEARDDEDAITAIENRDCQTDGKYVEDSFEVVSVEEA